MILLPKCYNVRFAIGQTNFYYDSYALEEVHKTHEFRMYVESQTQASTSRRAEMIFR